MLNPVAGPVGGLFRILGPLEVWSGQTWIDVSAAKWRALLAVLLLHPGQPVSTDRLIAELWGEQPPSSALNLISVYIHHLRKLIGDSRGDILMTRAPGYLAALRPGDLDAQRFEDLLARGRQALAGGGPARAAELLAEALGCWRGQALADVPGSPLVSAEAERLEQSRTEARRLRAEADLALGRAGEVVAEVSRLLADNPLREELWLLLMRALLRAGRQAEALEAYGKAREVLAGELGADPGPGLQRLYHQILNAKPTGPGAAAADEDTGLAMAAAPAPPAQLPADIADFTGRADQVERVCGLLSGKGGAGSPGMVPVMVIMGWGGLGKTTLAVHAAHQVAGQFPDGQLYANLHGATQPANPAEVLARFLRDLGADAAQIPVGEEERAAQFRTRLAGKRVLIVLDDARDAAQVEPLLPGSASAAVLVTARGRLPELAGSSVLDLDVLPPGEAHALFARVAGRARAAAEPGATAEVLKACAGLPLAIRIAGAWLAARPNWSVRTLADRLADERRRLHVLRVGNLAVEASFEVSFASLPGPAGPGGVDPARAFRLLGLWTGPVIGLAAASALLGEPEGTVAGALDVLVDAHLLESPEPDVYRFHDLLRVYAAERARGLEDEQARHAALTRLLTWYLHTVEAAARVIAPQHSRVPLGPPPALVRPLEFASLDEAVVWAESSRDGLVAATRLAADTGLHQIAWELAAGEMSFFYRRGHWADWVATHQVGLASARALGDRPAEAWMLNNLGMAYGVQGMDESIACFEQSLAIAREAGDVVGEARAANSVATACFDLGRFGDALAAAERSLVIQRRAGRRRGEGLALLTMGGACRELGRLGEAREHLEQALAIFRERGSGDAEADALSDLGETYLELGKPRDAIESLSQSLVIRHAIEDRRGGAVTLYLLGRAHYHAGEVGQAVDCLSEAVPLLRELADENQAGEAEALLSEITAANR